MDQQVPIPAPTAANRYIPSNPAMEKLPVVQQMCRVVLSGLPIEAGVCAGHAEASLAVEFHQGSEEYVFFTDVELEFGKRGQMQVGQFNAEKDAKLFFVPAGTVV